MAGMAATVPSRKAGALPAQEATRSLARAVAGRDTGRKAARRVGGQAISGPHAVTAADRDKGSDTTAGRDTGRNTSPDADRDDSPDTGRDDGRDAGRDDACRKGCRQCW